MDYDADGRTDIVTGSYTGQLYLFRRQEDGGFAQRELLTHAGGEALIVPEYSVVPELVDMDADGDLDLVVGTRSDPVFVYENVGTRSAPVWSKDFRHLKTSGGETIQGSNAHHADWDGDGVRDLLVGSEWGEVRWYRNTGANDAPKYAKGEVLVARSPHGDYAEEGSTPEHPGMRVKVHVTDWNDDGRPDLLVGDVTWQYSIPNPLTETEQAEKRALDTEYQQAWREYRGAAPAKREAAKKRVDELRAKLRPYDRRKLHTHGWVWLYERRAAAAPSRGQR